MIDRHYNNFLIYSDMNSIIYHITYYFRILTLNAVTLLRWVKWTLRVHLTLLVTYCFIFLH